MKDTILLRNTARAPGLRLLGLGPGLMPLQGIKKLKRLFNENTSWAQNRSNKNLKKMLLFPSKNLF